MSNANILILCLFNSTLTLEINTQRMLIA